VVAAQLPKLDWRSTLLRTRVASNCSSWALENASERRLNAHLSVHARRSPDAERAGSADRHS
jgi:hypothetical protein